MDHRAFGPGPFMRLTELEPEFLRWVDDRSFTRINSIVDADGIVFLCPKCFRQNSGPTGTHSIICWQPHVPQSTYPSPGRWTFSGTGFDDLSLTASSSSIALTGGCMWHGYITNGEVSNA